jgi:hypothetical protein
MIRFMVAAASAAELSLVAAIVIGIVSGCGISGPGAIPSPTATPTAIPTKTPVATGAVFLHEGILTGGRYRMQPLDDPSTLRIVADVPAGWQGFGSSVLVSPGETSNTGILLGFMVTDGLFSDPCHWDLDGSGSSQATSSAVRLSTTS